MGLFYIHEEDSKHHIYMMRNRLIWFSYIILIIAVVIISFRTKNIYLTIMWVILFLIALLEYAPIGYRRFIVHLKSGKKEETKGNIFSGNVEIRIEK